MNPAPSLSLALPAPAEERVRMAGAGAAERLVVATFALLGVGLLLAATSAPPGEAFEAVRRQGFHVAVGIALLLLAARVPREVLRRAAPAGYGIALVLLALVLVPGVGTVANSARRWFRIGSLSLQPSEFAKLALIVFLADFAARKGERLREARSGFLPAFACLLLPSALVLAEPDFGTAIYLFLVGTALLAVGGVRIRHLGAAAALAIPLLALAGWARFEHVRERFASVVSGPPYQVRRAILALGSGEIFGRGVGRGGMKWGYVPEGRNDFVFATLGEETGLLGSLLVLGLYGVLLHAGLRASQALRGDAFGTLLVFGIVFAIGLQAALNLSVVTGLAPPKGIALPFLSAGGTSIAVLAAGVGFAASAARQGVSASAPPSAEGGRGRRDGG